MILTIDIGNSNIVLGGYEEGTLRFMARMATSHHLEADQYAVQLGGILSLYGVSGQAVSGVIISSVVPGVTGVVARALGHFTNEAPHILSLADAGPIRVDIDNPGELGMDILASALAVHNTCPLPAVIIDMGTATKLTALTADAVLPGVSISPGLFVSLEALVGSTSLLRGISLDAPPAAIGRNTSASMQSGIVLGNAAMLDGMIERFEAEIGPAATIVATGGAAPLVIPHCRRSIQFSDSLLLDGLLLAYTHLKNN